MEKNMKKIYSLILVVAALAAFSACSQEDFDSKYNNPSKTTTVSPDKMMTGAFMAGRDYTFNAYWRMYTWDNYMGKLAQTIGFGVQSGTMYFVNDGYASDRWGNFYKLLTQYRVAVKTWEAEDDDAKKVDRIFLALTEVFLYDHLSQIVDIWGPVPFTKAGFLGVTSDIADAYPAYDKDEDLYKMMLTNLDALYTEISSYKATMTDLAKTKLQQQDFINGGDLDKWLVYANALRLRLGVHVSAQGSLTGEGKAAVSSAAKRVLPTDWASSIKVASDFDGFNYWENFRDGYKDINATANQKMIDAMQIAGENDPRLPVIYYPNEAGNYFGEFITETSDEQNEHNTYNDYEERYYARLNSATFTYNNLLVSPVFSAAEAWFLLAEAYQQGYASGNAKEAFVKGVVASTEQYFNQNVNSDQSKASNSQYFKKFTAEDIPSTATVEAYANKVWDKYTDKMDAIMTQKWLHFGIMQPSQAWTDIRRTGYPKLDYPADNGASVIVKNIAQRVKYPNSELTNNRANYDANASNIADDYYTVLFWAKKLQ